MAGQKLGEVFYEIELRGVGAFNKGVGSADDALDALAKGGGKAALGVTAAIGAAMLATAYKVTQMAAQFDASMRKISAAAPAAAAEIGKLRGAIEDVAAVSPRTHEALADAAALIAKIGGGTAEEIAARLRAAVQIADAAGTDLNATVEAMDFTMDAFGLTTEQATDALARMFAITHGKIAMEDLFTVLQRGGTTLGTLGVKAEDAATALTALVDAGTPTRQAGTVLISILEQLSQAGKIGASATDEQRVAAHRLLAALSPTNIAAKGLAGAIGDLSKSAHDSVQELQKMGFGLDEASGITRIAAANTKDARTESEKLADAYRQVHESAGLNNESTTALAQILKNQLVTALIELGTQVLPIVNAELKGLVGLIDALSGRTARAVGNASAVTTINTITASLDKLDPAGRARDMKRLRESIEQLGGGSPAGFLNLPALTSEELKALQRGLAAYIQQEAPGLARVAIGENMRAIGEELQKRGALNGDPATPSSGKTTTPVGGANGLSAAEAKAIKDRQDAMVEAAQQALAKVTATMRDDLELELNKLLEDATRNFVKLGAAIPPAVVAQIEQLRGEIARVPLVESLSIQFDDLSRRASDAASVLAQGYSDATADMFDEFQILIAQTQHQLDNAQAGTEEEKKLVELLRKEKELRDKIAGKASDLSTDTKDENKSHEERIRLLVEQARKVEQIGTAAINLANAFGLVNDETARILDNVVSIAANLPGAFGGDPGSIAAVAGSLGQLVAGAFGGSHENKEHLALLKKNNEVLKQLGDVIGEFGLAITGKTFDRGSRAANALAGFLSDPSNGDELRRHKLVDVERQLDATTGALGRLGLSMDDIRKLAGQLGIALDERNAGTLRDSLKQLFEALQQTQLTQFASTFAGQITALNAEFSLFDISDPIAQLKKLVDLFDNPNFGAPALRDALAGLDLNTPEGRAAAEQAIQNLFTALQNGTLAPSSLGDPTPQEFLDQLLKVKQLIDSGQAAAGDTGTGGYNIDRTITEATGSHITGLLTSANVYAKRSMLAVEMIADYLARSLGSLPAIQPPTLPTRQGGAGSGVTIVINVGSVGTGVSAAAAQAIGQAIGEGAAPAISKALGRDLRLRRFLAGSVVLNA